MKILPQIGSLAFVLGLFTAVFAGIPWHVIVAEDPVPVPWWVMRACVTCDDLANEKAQYSQWEE